MRIDRTFKQYTDAEDKDLIGFLKIFSGRSAGTCGSGYTKQATTAHL